MTEQLHCALIRTAAELHRLSELPMSSDMLRHVERLLALATEQCAALRLAIPAPLHLV
jgi:hypothetical protein